LPIVMSPKHSLYALAVQTLRRKLHRRAAR
jgi:hypothetical protein